MDKVKQSKVKLGAKWHYRDGDSKGGNSMTKWSELFAGLVNIRKQIKMATFQSRAFLEVPFLVPSTPPFPLPPLYFSLKKMA